MQNVLEKKKLFICMPDIPYPPRKHGLSIRYYPIIEHASQNFNIHLTIICTEDLVPEHVVEVKKFCKKISIHKRKLGNPSLLKKFLSRLKSLLFLGKPYVLVRHDEPEIIKFILNETEGEVYDIALNVSISNSDLVKNLVKYNKYSLDMVDSLYSLVARYPKGGVLDFIDRLVIKFWERKEVSSADMACYISPLDRLIGSGEAFNDEKIKVIPNGFFVSDYEDAKHNYGAFTLGFIGNMGYPPNIKAALRLARVFLSVIEAQGFNWRLAIIGRLPTPEILALAHHENIIVTGTVDNIWPYVNGVDLFAFPMEIGSGQQNKLLEAMCVGKPVITTQLGNSGIGAKNLEHIIEVESDKELADAIIYLAENQQERERLGSAAKEFVTEKYSWNGVFNLIDKTLLLASKKVC
jgi:glycosyltransferase involved in cell wall biosynthesis